MNQKSPHCARKWKIITLALAVSLAATVAALVPVSSSRADTAGVKYALKVDQGGSPVVDVTLSFNMKQAEKTLLKPSDGREVEADEPPAPQVEIKDSPDGSYAVEALSPPGSGWLLTSPAGGEVSIKYTVTFQEINSARSDTEAPGGVAPPSAISEPDLKLFRGSDVLLSPRTEDGDPVSKEFRVEVALSPGEVALSPWTPVSESDGSFDVSGERELFENFICWGKLELEEFESGGTTFITGFSTDRAKQSDSERKAEKNALDGLFSDLVKMLGEREKLDRLSILLCGAERFGLDEPSAQTLLQSAVVMSDSDSLTGVDAVAAAGGLFELWNRYSLVPEPGAAARWFQEGLSLFYPLRLAALGGLMNSEDAYREFSRIYRSYLTNPMALEMSLEDAESDPGALPLLAEKGAAVTASIAKKLPADSEGKVRDIDWLLAQLLERRDAFDGKEYSLVDISEILEGVTGESWDRYFDGRIRGTVTVLSSEFSASDLFGSTSGFSRNLVAGKGSGRSWIYLLVAIFLIFLIPIVMSPYVRRSVKLDVSMPKIFPDDD